MATYTYYYILSLMFLAVGILYLVGLIYFRKTGNTILEKKLDEKSEEHRRLSKQSKNQNLIIVVSIVLTLVINLGYSVRLILNLDSSEKTALIVAGPVIVLAVVILGVYFSRKLFNK